MGILEDVDRTIDIKKYGGIEFEFPLFKMWEERLKDHHILTNFDWQQYDQYGDELEACVNERDRSLFRSTVTMIDRFLDRWLKRLEKLEKMADPSEMNSSIKSMQRKVKMFKNAWSSGFVSFNLEDCINSAFNEEGKADVRSSPPSTLFGSHNGAYGLSPDP
ncbi:hypothetical protein MRB53_005893 [Persea americana]|uniref:Uncharacterized protein n=1 Tax=Persea americana TaxID=3435 RepID=A0ACC2MEQ4_PERAE|nr:hypothetical protein MRB53_005893 [Persea americana]